MARRNRYIRLGDYLMASRRIESVEIDGVNNRLILGMTSGSFFEVICSSVEECQRMFILVATVINGTDGNAIVESESSGNSNAYYKDVDLGLPSGLLWADRNVGANAPEGCGLHFAWGDTVGYGQDPSDGHLFEWSTCPWGEYGLIPSTLDAGHDAATANMGSEWRMPDRADYEELLRNCTTKWTIQNGVKGRLFTSKANGNTLFFPAAGTRYFSSPCRAGRGYYWSRSLNISNAASLYFSSSNCRTGSYYRYYGCSVRGVTTKTEEGREA